MISGVIDSLGHIRVKSVPGAVRHADGHKSVCPAQPCDSGHIVSHCGSGSSYCGPVSRNVVEERIIAVNVIAIDEFSDQIRV